MVAEPVAPRAVKVNPGRRQEYPFPRLWAGTVSAPDCVYQIRTTHFPCISMINAIAGPYGRNYSQGTIGGVLGTLGCRQDQVWKL